MKTYNNGPRKAMMYGGAAKRKPMMYGGTAMKKPRKKAYGGGMMSAKQGQQNQMQNQMMQQPKPMGLVGYDTKITKKGCYRVRTLVLRHPFIHCTFEIFRAYGVVQ